MRASEIRSRSDTPAASSFAGIGRWPHSGIPGAPTGPALRSTITRRRVDLQLRVVDPGGEIVDVLEDDCAALVLEQCPSAAETFITAPSGQRLPGRTTRRRRSASGSAAVRITSGFDDPRHRARFSPTVRRSR